VVPWPGGLGNSAAGMALLKGGPVRAENMLAAAPLGASDYPAGPDAARIGPVDDRRPETAWCRTRAPGRAERGVRIDGPSPAARGWLVCALTPMH